MAAFGLLAATALCGPPTMARAASTVPSNATPTVSELIVTATKSVSELTVTATAKCLAPETSPEHADRPKVVSSFPGKGALVRPGLLVIRITFNAPMACAGVFSGIAPHSNPCPEKPLQMLLSYDRRTVRTVCFVQPNTQYGLGLSRDLAGDPFMGLAGLPSLPFQWNFATSDDAAVANVCEALAEDEETAREIRKRRSLDCTDHAR
jgi:hypothetical protein